MTPKPLPAHLKREADHQREIVLYLRALRLLVFITSEPRAKRSSRHVWDLYVITERNGRTGWFETKTEGGTLTEGQRAFQQAHCRSEVMFGWGQLPHAIAFAARLGATSQRRAA